MYVVCIDIPEYQNIKISRKRCIDSNVLHEISQLQFHPSHTPYTHTKKAKALQVIKEKHKKSNSRPDHKDLKSAFPQCIRHSDRRRVKEIEGKTIETKSEREIKRRRIEKKNPLKHLNISTSQKDRSPFSFRSGPARLKIARSSSCRA